MISISSWEIGWILLITSLIIDDSIFKFDKRGKMMKFLKVTAENLQFHTVSQEIEINSMKLYLE